MLTILAPFYEATKMLSGVSYATLNMVSCTMHHLKKTIAPPNNDKDYYAELLYGKLDITASQSSPTNIPSDNKIIELAVRAKQALDISHAIEPPVITTNILEQVKATIYLSM
ncbi:9099_t:CDS:2, partial [Gigaspora rosea]